MTPPRQAFDAALALNLVGIFFDTAAVLASVRGYATGDLAARATEQVDALKAHRRQAKASIETVEDLLSPDAAPPAPEHPDHYGAWAQACSEQLYGGLDEAGAAAYTAGWWLGAWLLAGNLVALSLYLGDAAPDDAYVAEVLATYAANAEAAASGIAQAAAATTGPLADALGRAQAAVQALPAPALGDGALEAAGAWQEALEALDGLLGELRAAL